MSSRRDTYYLYQDVARGITSVVDSVRAANEVRFLWDRVLLPWMPTARTARIYEVGCGSGMFQYWAKSHGYVDIAGSDISEAQVTIARAGGHRVEVRDSIDAIWSSSECAFELIVGLDFYEHLTPSQCVHFLEGAYRALTPGGALILRGPNGESPFVGRALFNDITHRFALTPTAFRAVLAMQGFRDARFIDDTVPGIAKHRWFRVPLASVAGKVVRLAIRAATRENIEILSSSLFLCARKP